jgi:hypothetical protein
MKKPFFLFLFLIVCLFAKTQVVTGVYKGFMQIDSPQNTVEFELTLKEKKGKLFGYCYRLFFVEDTLYYNLVRVNARIANDVLIVEDEVSVSNNFEQNTRGIKTVFFFKLKDIADSAYILPGEWSTARWRNYLPLTGKITVSRERNYKTTQLYKRLAEKKLDESMAFEEPKQTPVISQPVAAETIPITNTPGAVAEGKPRETVLVPPKQDTIAIVQSPPITKIETPKPEQQPLRIPEKAGQQVIKPKEQPVVQNKQEQKQAPSSNNNVAKNNSPAVQESKPVNQPAAQNKQQQQVNKPAGEPKPISIAPVTAPIEQPTNQPSLTKIGQVQNADSARLNNKTSITAPMTISNPVLTKRETELIQTLTVVEDSITLSLYDNGEIDGDIVSVFLNNEEIISKVSLNATAYKKTIYLQRGQTAQLTLYAESLGTIPPNTGLLVVYSGEKRYQVFFSSTLSKSAVVLLKRDE